VRDTRTDWLGHGLKPYMYVMPVIKTARDRDALREEAQRQRHSRHVQRADRDRDLRQGPRGGGGARQARSLRLAQRREALQAAVNTETITLEKSPLVAPEEVKVEGPDERAIVYCGGETIEWKVTAS
jgi:dihydroorotase